MIYRRYHWAGLRKQGWIVFGMAAVVGLGYAIVVSPPIVAAPAAVVDQTPSAGTAGSLAATASTVRYVNSNNSGEALVSGTSTLHDWTVKSSSINGGAEFSGELKGGSDKTITFQSIELSIPVNSLKSTEGSGMDNTMYDAMKLKKFPNISFKMTKVTLKSSPSAAHSAYHFDATGQLTVSGNAHAEDLDLEVTPTNDGKLTIETETKLKMTDFGVTPPTFMFGAIKSGDSITVKVTWKMAIKP